MRTVRYHQYVSRDTIHRSGSLESNLIITHHEFLGKTGVERVLVLRENLWYLHPYVHPPYENMTTVSGAGIF